MKINLIAFIFMLFFVGQIDGSKKSKFPNINEKSLNLAENNGDVSYGPFCKSLTAYYVGTLQNKYAKQTYNVQFQLKLWVDDEKKKIHVYADKWNEKYSKSKNFELDFYYDGNRLWCDIYDDDCVSPFAKRETSFKLDLNTATGNYFHLLNFNFFNNSFSLNKPLDKCTKHQLSGLNDDYTPDLDQLGFCVCCDEYEPDELLACPSDKWAHEKTTQKPLETTKKAAPTTKKPIKTTISLVPHDRTCQKIIGYYVGTFQWPIDRSHTFDAQFQLKMDSNLQDKKFYFGITNWNQSYLDGNDDYLGIHIDDYPNGYYYCYTPNRNCSAPFVNTTVFKYISIQTFKEPYWFDILQFPSFNDSFTLKNTLGGCTKHQPPLDGHHYIPDPSLFSYCVCCDKYNPHPSLNCPPNPWQGL